VRDLSFCVLPVFVVIKHCTTEVGVYGENLRASQVGDLLEVFRKGDHTA
jgi:hypothetical protein